MIILLDTHVLLSAAAEPHRLSAQAQVEDITLYTNDPIVASYPGNIELV